MTFITFRSDAGALEAQVPEWDGLNFLGLLASARACQRVSNSGFAWYSFGTAIDVLQRVNVVLAGSVLGGCVHGLHSNAAMGESRLQVLHEGRVCSPCFSWQAMQLSPSWTPLAGRRGFSAAASLERRR